MSFSQRLKERREQVGLTQIELANILGITKGTIGNYETGFSSPKADILYKLFDALNCDANYLFQDEMNIKKEPDTQSVSSPDLQKIKETLVQFLTLAGYIKPGEDITDEQLRFLEGVILLLDHYFDQQL